MAILWPTTVPSKPLFDSYSETIPDTRLRTSMGAGPAKMRPKSAAVPVPIAVNLHLTSEELVDLEDFIGSTLIRGSLRFEFPHPRKGTTIEARVVGGDHLYTVTASGLDRWTVSMQLEIMP